MANRRSRWRRARRILAGLALAAIVAVGAPNAWILLSTRGLVTAAADAPAAPIAIVLGASVRRDGAPSGILADRLDVALELWRSGRVGAVLVSGDRDAVREYDEVGVMARYLADRGVPAHALWIDPHGYRTYDSLWRARHAFGIARALVVSNAFHLPRAVWTARRLGIDCHGVAPQVSDRTAARRFVDNAARESLARVAAVLDVCLDRAPAVATPADAPARPAQPR